MATKVKKAMVALLRLIGLAFSCATLLAVLVCVHIGHCCAHLAVAFFEWITGAKIRSSLQAHKQRQENIKNIKYEEPVEAGIIDTEATLSVANSAKVNINFYWYVLDGVLP